MVGHAAQCKRVNLLENNGSSILCLVSKLTNNIQQRIAHGKFNPNKNFSKLIIFKLVKGYLITDTILDGNFCPPLRRCEWRNRMLKYMKRKL